MIKDIGCSRK